MNVNQNRVDEFIKKVNQITSYNNVPYSVFFELEREYLSIRSDETIPKKEKGRIWLQSRYEVVYMICSGVRWEQEQKIKKEIEGRE